jgi:hypothetical protein
VRGRQQGVMWGVGVWPTGVAVSVGVGVWPTRVAVGLGEGVWPTGVGVGVGEGVWPTGVAVGVCPAGVGEGVWPTGVGEGVWPTGVGEAVDAAQASKPMWLVSSVTAPLRANVLPDTLAPVAREILVSARILPTNLVVEPRTAEVFTFQKTLQSVPPLVIKTEEPLAVVSSLALLKMKTAAESPWALSVSWPVNWTGDVEQ